MLICRRFTTFRGKPVKDTFVQSGDPKLDHLVPRIRDFLLKSCTEYNMFGTRVRGYRAPDTPSIWIRDYSDMMRAFRYWEKDMKGVIDHFAETQSAKGWLFDYFTMTPEKVPCEKENWAKYVRVPIEADVEYRFIKAVYLAWQATGDDGWLRGLIPHMERALHYVMTDEWRWDRKTKLVKRGYTLDTWDFDYTAGRHEWLNFQINDDTFWGIMHGDNSGYYEAFVHMTRFYKHLKNHGRARYWRKFADAFRRRANNLCYNGRFYKHHVHLVPVSIDGVDETRQLSLSNPMDINRGLATHDMAVSILGEYQERAKTSAAFAEWFSIDPPFPDGVFGDEKLVGGAYCNGGIMPLVGGELARAAFEHGFEQYGVAQLLKYEELTGDNSSYLWYFPDGQHATVETSTSPDSSPADAWGSSAMLYAVIEGLAGIVDEHKLFRRVRLSPRWAAAGCDEVKVGTAYGASGAHVAYSYADDKVRKEIELGVNGVASVSLHLLLPRGAKAKGVHVNGKKVKHVNRKVGESSYVDSAFDVRKKGDVLIRYV